MPDETDQKKVGVMGLDQYGYAVMPSGGNTDFHIDWQLDKTDKVGLLAQWRKHPNLHKWMEQLYLKKAEEQGIQVDTSIQLNTNGALFSAMAVDPVTGDTKPVQNALEGEDLDKVMALLNEQIELEVEGDVISDFNQKPIRLTLEDLDKLESAVKDKTLPVGNGPFWGSSTPEHKNQTLNFIVRARWAIAEGLEIYYNSWW
jgi:hypothetical protein